MKRTTRALTAAFILLLLIPTLAAAQAGSTAQIAGTVKDDTGGVLPGVTITVTQTATSFTRTAVSDETGGYVLPNLPVGPYRLTVPARRTRHIRFNDLRDPEVIPRDTDFSSVIRSDVPIVAQHTRLDSRQDANALLSTIAYPSAA